MSMDSHMSMDSYIQSQTAQSSSSANELNRGLHHLGQAALIKVVEHTICHLIDKTTMNDRVKDVIKFGVGVLGAFLHGMF